MTRANLGWNPSKREVALLAAESAVTYLCRDVLQS